MICPHCHSENRDGAKFCNECGERLAPSAQETVVLDSALASEGARDETSQLYAELSREAELDDFTEVDEEIIDAVQPHDDSPVDGASQADDAPDQAPDGPRTPASTGSLDPARVPEIDLPAVSDRTTEDGFSCGETQVMHIDSAKTADLSGLERLVDSSYVPPERSWRSGDTMEIPKIEGEPPKQQKQFKAPDANDEKKRSHRKHVLIAVFVVVVLCAVAAGVTYYLELWGGKTVPDVTGEAQTDAVWMLESKGFSVNTTQVKSDEVEGIVLITDPAGGSRVKAGSTVNVSVAAPRAVPDIMGKTQDEAQAALDKEGLSNVTFTTQKSNEAEGTVIALSLDAGTKVKAATALTVTIAESYVVPDVAGKSQDDAQAALEDAGYKVSIAVEYTEDVAEGTALSTDPAAGSKLNSGSTVTLAVAKSRAREVVSATRDFFSVGATVYVNGVSYEVSSCDDVTYEGGGKASYTITARKFETVSTIWFGSQTIYGSSETLTGTITWGTDGTITGSTPKLNK